MEIETDSCVKTEVETGVMYLQAKEQQRLSVTIRGWEELRKDSSLQVADGVWPCWYPDFRLLASRPERRNVCFKPPSLW